MKKIIRAHVCVPRASYLTVPAKWIVSGDFNVYLERKRSDCVYA